MKKFFWIASYPKSGNTWMRAIISSLFFTKSGNFNFKLLNNIAYFDYIDSYKFVKTINQSDYKKLYDINVCCKYYLEAQRRADFKGDFSFFKTHSSNLFIKKYKYTNEELSKGLIYIVRDPRDICISHSHFHSISIEDSINRIFEKKTINFTPNKSGVSVPVFVSSWDQHYLSWNRLDVPKMIIRYEDLVLNTEENIRKIIFFFEENYNFVFENKSNLIKNILNTTNFNKLSNYEKKYGFKESNQNYFFRTGKSNQWLKILEKNQILKIETEFEPTMKELGYL